MYERLHHGILAPNPRKPRLMAIIDAMFAPEFFSREELNIWLALWSEIVNNPALKREHRRQYTRYRRSVDEPLAERMAERGLTMPVRPLAQMLIALVDGLCLERCIKPKLLSPRATKKICLATLEHVREPLPQN